MTAALSEQEQDTVDAFETAPNPLLDDLDHPLKDRGLIYQDGIAWEEYDEHGEDRRDTDDMLAAQVVTSRVRNPPAPWATHYPILDVDHLVVVEADDDARGARVLFQWPISDEQSRQVIDAFAACAIFVTAETDDFGTTLHLDVPAHWVPSSTQDHGHLYIDCLMPWDALAKLLDVLVDIALVEEGYANASKARGYTAVRLPWVSKLAPWKPEDVDIFTWEREAQDAPIDDDLLVF